MIYDRFIMISESSCPLSHLKGSSGQDCIQPLRPGPSRCCLFAAAAPARQPVLWGAVPLRAPLQDVAAQTDEDARLLALEEQLRDSGRAANGLRGDLNGSESQVVFI